MFYLIKMPRRSKRKISKAAAKRRMSKAAPKRRMSKAAPAPMSKAAAKRRMSKAAAKRECPNAACLGPHLRRSRGVAAGVSSIPEVNEARKRMCLKRVEPGTMNMVASFLMMPTT